MSLATSTATETPPSVSPGATPAQHQGRDSALILASFAAVYLLWGSTFLAIRLGIESIPPLLLAGSRHLATGILLYPVMSWKTGVRPSAANWRAGFVTGCLLLVVGNGGVCLAERTVPSGVAALLITTVSLWMVLIDWLRPGGSRPVPRVIAGLILGFAGLALLVGPKNLGGSGRADPKGVAILALASFAWAAGSIYSKHGNLPTSPMLGAAMQSLSGGVVLWGLGALIGETGELHLAGIYLRSWLALAYLVAFGSMIGLTAYIYLLKKSTAAKVATYALVNSVVALFLGWLMVGEAITLRTLLAAAVILTAVVLVITAPHRQPRAIPSAVPLAAEDSPAVGL